MDKVLIIKRDNILKLDTLSISGPQIGTHTWSILKDYSIKPLPDGRYLIRFTSRGSGSIGITRFLTLQFNPKEIIVDKVEIYEELTDGKLKKLNKKF